MSTTFEHRLTKVLTSAPLAKYLEGRTGSIRNLETDKELGGHEGLWNYTVGERARIPNMLQRWYVADKDTVNNIVYVVPGP